MGKYREGLERRQMIFGRLIEIGTDLFAIAATCSYAVSLHKDKPQDDSPIKLAEYFCHMARRRIKDRFDALSDNDDREANQIAKSVANGDYRWLEEGIMWMGPNI